MTREKHCQSSMAYTVQNINQHTVTAHTVCKEWGLLGRRRQCIVKVSHSLYQVEEVMCRDEPS